MRTLTLLLLLAACGGETPAPAPAPAPEPPPAPAAAAPKHTSLFAVLPDDMHGGNAASKELVDLGRMLYYDTRLSKNHDISCNSCHMLDKFGVDNQPTSPGHKGQLGGRNSPTSYNAALHFVQFWDGRAANVEEQAKGPILNPVEMAMPSEPVVVKVLESMPEYVELFKKAFPNDPKPISYDNMAKAIGAFERGLMTPSRWDALLKGDQSALTDAEKLGFKTYTEAGCQMCHRGALLGGTSYQVLGLAKDYPRSGDPGRAKVTNDESDKNAFKVPSLRNVEKTGPFFHDGQTPTLEQAVKEMAEFQLGRTLTDQQTAQIVDFLKVLTGKIDPEYIKPPVLPKSTPATPKPDEG